MSGELPEGWASARLDNLLVTGVFSDGDWVESKDQDPNGDVRLVQLADVGDGCYRNKSARFLTRAKAKELGCTFLQQGDILIARMPDPLGRACEFPGDSKASVTVVDVCIARPAKDGPILPRLLMYEVNSWRVRSMMEEHERGTTRKRISRTNLGSLELAVAPLPEQRRIVTQVEALLEQVNRAKGRLDRVPLILKRFRQAVLAAAFSGELTPGLDSEAWEKTLLGAVIDGFEAGRNLKSQGRSAGPGEFGVLKISAVTWGNFRPDENKALLPGDEPRPRERIRAGDVLITRANTYDLVGAVVLVANDHPNLMLPDKILRLRLKTGLVDGRFLVHALRSKEVRDHFESEATGTSDSMRNLSQPKMEAAPLILPPLNEQALVADAIGRLLTLADAIERRVQVAISRADRLPQAILSKAFCGELVPTEADLARAEGRTYESAEELLERVRREAERGLVVENSAVTASPRGGKAHRARRAVP